MLAVLILAATPALPAQDAAPLFTLQPTGAVVMAGQSIRLVAEASGNPAPQLSWQFNGGEIADQNGSTLSLNLLATNQSGAYRLQASNALGVAYSDAVLLSILPVYPSILVQPTNVSGFEGDTLLLTVQAMPTPASRLTFSGSRKACRLMMNTPYCLAPDNPTFNC
ncbi:MAG: immunoglobulin domain-containing protein [Verrucomicrobia bacterium]|nr:immunoglobulin domain-containing protein [Verrucomicrobiota bacterium]